VKKIMSSAAFGGANSHPDIFAELRETLLTMNNALDSSASSQQQQVTAVSSRGRAIKSTNNNNNNKKKQRGGGAVNLFSPSGLLRAVGAKNEFFRGGRQQDSHELLRFLIDAVVMEIHDAFRAKKRAFVHSLISKWTQDDVLKWLSTIDLPSFAQVKQNILREQSGKVTDGDGKDSVDPVIDGHMLVQLSENSNNVKAVKPLLKKYFLFP